MYFEIVLKKTQYSREDIKFISVQWKISYSVYSVLSVGWVLNENQKENASVTKHCTRLHESGHNFVTGSYPFNQGFFVDR